MKYTSFRSTSGYESVGALVDNDTRIMDVGSRLPASTAGLSPMRRLLEHHGATLPTSAEEFLGLPGFDAATVEILPLVPDPEKIIAAPVNYFDHKAEMNEDAHIDALGVFLKAPTSVLAAGRTVELPYTDRRFDQEGELAFVIGTTARNVTASEAPNHIAGYTCLLDMTMRGGEDRSTRKSFDTFTPVGPFLVTPDEAGDLSTMRLQTRVNGELRQDADISALIWGVADLLAYASSVMTLHPGDILTTGTPAGIGQIHDGDTISVEITRLGTLEVAVSAKTAVACPTKGANRGPKPPETVTPVARR